MVITQHTSGSVQFFDYLPPEWIDEPEDRQSTHVEFHGDVFEDALTCIDSSLGLADEITCFGCSAEFLVRILRQCKSSSVFNYTCCRLPASLVYRRSFLVARFDQCVCSSAPFTGLSARTIVVKLPCDHNCFVQILTECQLFFIEGRNQRLNLDIDYRNAFPHRLSGFHCNRVKLDEMLFGELICVNARDISISGTVGLINSTRRSVFTTTCVSLNLRNLSFEDAESLPRILHNQRSIEHIVLPECVLDDAMVDFLGSLPNLTSLSLDRCSALRIPKGVILPNIRKIQIFSKQKRWRKELAASLPNAEIVLS